MFGLLKATINKRYSIINTSNIKANIFTNYISKCNFSQSFKKKRDEIIKLSLRRPQKWQIFVNDKVKVVYGKNTGLVGKVKRVHRNRRLLIIEGVNPKEVHRDPTSYFDQYSKLHKTEIKPRTIYKPERMDYCRIVDPKSNKVVKVGFKEIDGKRERFIKNTGEPLPRQDVFKTYLERASKRQQGSKDTDPKSVLTKTFTGIDYVEVARNFLNRIKEIKMQEEHLPLKDKKFEPFKSKL